MRTLLIGQSLVLCGAMLASGCSSDSALAGDGEFDADTGYSGVGDDEGPVETDSVDSGASDEGSDGPSDGSESGATGSGNADDSGGEGDFDPCEFVDCSGIGTCISSEGDTWCECPEGYLGEGESCVACKALSDIGELSLSTFELKANIKHNGAELPTAIYERADFWLENRATGDRVELGRSYEGELSALVLPGAYDLIYEHVSGDLLPKHTHYLVQTVIVRTDSSLEVDLRSAPVSGNVSLNGAPPPTVQYDDGNIYFVNEETGDEVFATSTRSSVYTAQVFGGTYQLRYRVEDAGEMVPANKNAFVKEVEVNAAAEISLANVELTSTTLSGDIQVNGSPGPNVQYDDGNVFLRTASGDEVELGSTRDPNYAVNIIPGEYVFEYELEDGGQQVPANQHARITDVTVPSGAAQTFTANIPLVHYSGSFMLNGAAAPASQYDDGILRLRDQSSGGEVMLGNTHDGAFDVGLIPGDYDLIYAIETAGPLMPVNVDTTIGSLALTQDVVEDVDVPSVAVAGAFSIAGSPPPTSEYEDGRLYLRSGAGEDAVLLGYTHDGDYQVNVIPTDYEVYFTHEFGSGIVPDNSNGSLMALSVSAPMSFDVDVPVVALAGSFTIDGGQPPNNYADSGQLFLRRRSDGDSISLGSTHAGSYNVAVTPGVYEVFYSRSASVATMPRNENGRVTCFVVE